MEALSALPRPHPVHRVTPPAAAILPSPQEGARTWRSALASRPRCSDFRRFSAATHSDAHRHTSGFRCDASPKEAFTVNFLWTAPDTCPAEVGARLHGCSDPGHRSPARGVEGGD